MHGLIFKFEGESLSDFISRFADDYLKTYLEASRTLKFDNIIREKA
jgi:hypothetical protein